MVEAKVERASLHIDIYLSCVLFWSVHFREPYCREIVRVLRLLVLHSKSSEDLLVRRMETYGRPSLIEPRVCETSGMYIGCEVGLRQSVAFPPTNCADVTHCRRRVTEDVCVRGGLREISQE